MSTKPDQAQIVSDVQWLAAHGRLEHTRQTYLRGTNGHLWGRPADGHDSKYLLTGLSRCGLCGGTLIVRSRSHGRRRAYFYACSSFHHRGKTVCPNSLEMPLEAADAAIVGALAHELLDPDILQAAADRAVARVATPPVDVNARRHALQKALTDTEAALARLTQAVAEGRLRRDAGAGDPRPGTASADDPRRAGRPRPSARRAAQRAAVARCAAREGGGVAGAAPEARADRASDAAETR